MKQCIKIIEIRNNKTIYQIVEIKSYIEKLCIKIKEIKNNNEK